MEVTEKITLDMLTKEGVSVLRQKFITLTMLRYRLVKMSAMLLQTVKMTEKF